MAIEYPPGPGDDDGITDEDGIIISCTETEKYELTSEQKKSIKNAFTLAKVAKKRAVCCNGYALIDVLKKEKEEKKIDMSIKMTLEDHVEFYKNFLDTLDTIAYSPVTENTRMGKLAEMYKPFVKKYIALAEDAVKIYNEIFEPQNEEYQKTGQITARPLYKSEESRLEEKAMIEKDKEKNKKFWEDSYKEATRLREEREKELGITPEPKKLLTLLYHKASTILQKLKRKNKIG